MSKIEFKLKSTEGDIDGVILTFIDSGYMTAVKEIKLANKEYDKDEWTTLVIDTENIRR